MASYLGHLSFSSALGAAYGSVAVFAWNLDWGPVFLGAGLTTIGGLLPDLDSESGVPVRELFSLAAVVGPVLLLHRLVDMGLSMEEILVVLGGAYLLIRYGLSRIFKKITVHRGIFHSIPAMLIAGLAVFHLYRSPNLGLRIYLALGTMLGFLSHLILDELCSVGFSGLKLRLNKYAGSALKFFSPSWPVNVVTYTLLIALAWLAIQETGDLNLENANFPDLIMNVPSRTK
ncbi:MAG: hypothetical protein KatS3mg105_4309 [Gemmatales bacterium]|nr:MAG: hypothetical protein KatS3mg105_4309 [Gemmatales bacterium]